MIQDVSVGTNDIESTRDFYNSVLAVLGLRLLDQNYRLNYGAGQFFQHRRARSRRAGKTQERRASGWSTTAYYGRNRISADGEALETAVAQILATNQANNAKAAITGALMLNSGCFAQVLEGPVGAVKATFARIQRDDRNGEVSLLGLDGMEPRSFGNWSMAFVGASIRDSEHLAAID